jgi:hypothetical protein
VVGILVSSRNHVKTSLLFNHHHYFDYSYELFWIAMDVDGNFLWDRFEICCIIGSSLRLLEVRWVESGLVSQTIF